MKVQLAPELIKKIKKQDVRIRKSFIQAIILFSKDPNNTELNNHELQRGWKGFRSIDVTADYRALYKEETTQEESKAYFVEFGTHKELYGD